MCDCEPWPPSFIDTALDDYIQQIKAFNPPPQERSNQCLNTLIYKKNSEYKLTITVFNYTSQLTTNNEYPVIKILLDDKKKKILKMKADLTQKTQNWRDVIKATK